MQKLYYFYTLSSSANSSNIRYVGVTTCKLSQRLSGHKYCALHKDKRSTPVHKWMFSEYTLGNTIIITRIDTCNVRNESAMKRAVKNKSVYLDSFWSFTKNAVFDLNSQFKYVEIDNNGNVIERFEKMQNVLDKYNCSISFLYRKNEACRGVLPNGNKIIKNYK